MKNKILQNRGMCEYEMLNQLENLIADRKSFLSSDDDLDNLYRNDIIALEKVIHDYKILRDAAYHNMEEKGENLCIWINENVRFRKAEIISTWNTEFGDIRCNAILYKGKKKVANIIASFDYNYINNLAYNMYDTYKILQKFSKNPFKTLIYESFENYLKLPKISRCSPLLKEIYDTVCNSDSNMCYITEKEWKENYAVNFNEKDIEFLKQEIKKYKLNNVIELNEDEYKILGYGNLQICFNDDRELKKRDILEKV